MKNYSNNLSNIFDQPTSDLVLSPEHGGPILCMSVRNDLIVTGSTDHGLRVYSVSNGKQLKQLYTKNYGHTEWVTAVTILNDMRIVSGGMDSNICLWEAKGVKCKTITDHSGSISKLESDENNIVLSSSYDSSVRIYDFNSSDSCVGTLKGVHKGPVTDFEWNNSLCVTGGRDGLVCLWDINSEKCISKQRLHNGQISKIKFHTDEINHNLIITSGINDGVVNILDMRSNTKIFSERIHVGAINFLETNKSNQIITGSADKTIKILDIVSGFQEIGTMKSTDSVFCGDIYDNFIAVGCGDGSLLAYNLDTLECLFGYGCDNKGGVKNVKILPDKRRIVTSGDSGQGMQLIF